MKTRRTSSLSLLALVVAATAGCPQYPGDDYGTGAPPVGTSASGGVDDDAPASDSATSGPAGDSTGGGQADGSDDSPPPPPPPPPDEPPPECSDVGEPCEYGNECCDFASGGALCVTDEVNTLCYATCTYPSECGTECCPPIDSGEHVCAPSVYCPPGSPGACAEPEEECATNGFCCGFAAGDSLCVIFPDGNECTETCSFNADCNTGCCVELDSGAKACVPSNFCGDNGSGFELDEKSAPTGGEAPRVDQVHAIR